MRDCPSDRGYRRRTTSTSVFVTLCLVFLSLASGCLSYQRVGDRAFDQGDCTRALEAYQQAIDVGTKDADMFHRAAKCSMRFGDFSAAERYYSQALRYGAGIVVARELADFYVRTSNYTSAVRVYQYLLHMESDKQPVYNNLGTALMYANQPFDAESYLMIAQQMDPTDPTPYLNLGLLYDRHLKQPWLAVNFYDCFLELHQAGAGSERVKQRSSELRDRYSRLYQPDLVECGEAYEPRTSGAPVGSLKEKIGSIELDPATGEPTNEASIEAREPSSSGSGETATGEDDIEETGEEDAAGSEVTIDRMITEDETPASADADSQATLQEARRAYDQGQWSVAVAKFTSAPMSAMRPVDQKLLGLSYLKQANWATAVHWLELARTTQEDPETIEGLFTGYEKAGDEERVASLCKKYGKSSKYEKVTRERCPAQGADDSDE